MPVAPPQGSPEADRSPTGTGRVHAIVDRLQRRWTAAAIAVAVGRKYAEDRGSELATIIAFYAFFSLFPLLLLVGSFAALLLEGDPELHDRAIEIVVEQLPDSPELREQVATADGSGIALAVGLVGTLWGALGVIGGLRSAFDRVWAVPIRQRSGFAAALAQNLALAAIAGLGLAASVAVAALARLAPGIPLAADLAGGLTSVALVLGAFALVFRVLSPADAPMRALLPGVLVPTAGWLVIGPIGAMVIASQVDRGPASGAFATSLVLLLWLALQARLVVLGAELDAVLANRWWPRSTSAAADTAGDRRTLRAHAEIEERVEGEEVRVSFDEAGGAPDETSSAQRSR